MEYVYSALLLHSAGKKVDEKSVKAVLTAAGVTADEMRLKALTAALEGVDIDEAIKTSGAMAFAAAPAGGAPAAGGAKKEEKKEEEEKKVSESEAAAGLGALFG